MGLGTFMCWYVDTFHGPLNRRPWTYPCRVDVSFIPAVACALFQGRTQFYVGRFKCFFACDLFSYIYPCVL